MLNWSQVTTYIRGMLALPSTFIEKTDQEIIDWIKLITIPEFSNYVPDWEITAIDTKDSRFKTTPKQDIYQFFDAEELPILGIRKCYFPADGDYFLGHPIMGAWSFSEISRFALNAFQSRLLKPFSNFDPTYRFITPNQIRILNGNVSGFIAIEYERQQPEDLRKIPAAYRTTFMNLALADVKIQIGSIRTMYGQGTITTPFGEIPLNGDQIKQEGVDLRREMLETLQENTLPPIIVDIS